MLMIFTGPLVFYQPDIFSAPDPELEEPSRPLKPTAVPTYDTVTWQEDSCVHNCRGKEFPEDAATITWWNGLETVLPFAAAKGGIPESQVRSTDTEILAYEYLICC